MVWPTKILIGETKSVLNKAARLVFSAPLRTPTTSFLMEFHWLPVKARVEFKICVMTFKVIKFGKPGYLSQLSLPASRDSVIVLRSGDDPYHLNETRVVQERSFADQSFSYIAPRLYNRLSMSMEQLTSR